MLSLINERCILSLRIALESQDEEELPLPSPPPILESPDISDSDPLIPFGLPSLPEPKERPPPPPTIHNDEPIYEAIQPRNHTPMFVEVFSLDCRLLISVNFLFYPVSTCSYLMNFSQENYSNMMPILPKLLIPGNLIEITVR